MNRILPFSILFVLMQFSVKAQDLKDLSTHQFLQQAEIAADSADFEQSEVYFAEALHQSRAASRPADEIFTLILWAQTAVTFGRETSFARYLSEADSLYQLYGLENDTLLADILYSQGVAFYQLQFEIDSSLAYITRALDLLKLNLGPNHPRLAPFLETYGALLINDAPDTALAYLERARELLLQEKTLNKKELATILHDRSALLYYQGRNQEALADIQEAIALRQQTQSRWHPDLAGNYNALALIYAALGDFFQEGIYLKKAIAIIEVQLPPDHPIRGILLSNLVGYYFDMENFEQGLEIAREAMALNVSILGKDHLSIGQDLNSIAVMHMNLGEYQTAILHLKRALEIQLADPEQASFHLGDTYHNLALSYREIGEAANALPYALQALETFQTYAPDRKENQAFLYPVLSQIYGELDNYPAQYKSIQAGFVLLKNRLPEEEYLEIDLYTALVTYYDNLKDYPKAVEAVKKAILLRRKALPRRTLELAAAYADLSKIYFKTGQLALAGSAIDSAFLFTQVEPVDLTFLADFSVGKEQRIRFPYLSNLIDLYALKAEIQQKQYQASRDLSLLDGSIADYQRALQILTQTKYRYRTDKDRMRLATISQQVAEKALSTVYEQYQLSGEAKYLTLAFEMMESTKGLNILQALIDHQAYSLSGIPGEVVVREKRIKQEMGTLRRKIWEEESIGQADSARIALWHKEWFNRDQAYTRLLDSLEELYPHYYDLKYNISVANLEDIQGKLIEQKQALLEYFTGDSSLHLLLILPDTVLWHKVEDMGWKTDLEKMLVWIRTDSMHVDQRPTPVDFHRLGSRLFETLIAPFADYLESERWIIVPDGILSYLPFDLLIQADDKQEQSSFASLNYVFQHHFVHYQLSASLWAESSSPKSPSAPRQELLAFAPFVGTGANAYRSSEGDSLTLLPASLQEVEAIMQRYPGQAYLGKAASREAWLREAPLYNMLHLATHSKAENRFPLSSRLYFSQETDSALFLSDLLGQPLQAGLVVLSACETGLGPYQAGEGMQSLSRGFFYAGAQSLLASLWKVDDFSTANLMDRFYTKLAEGYPKDEALTLAKRDYLREIAANREYPYYWAGFSLSGNMDPLPPQRQGWYLWLGSLLAVLLGVFWLRRRGKQQQSPK